jgi:isoleucyl-tRNA synthetase
MYVPLTTATTHASAALFAKTLTDRLVPSLPSGVQRAKTGAFRVLCDKYVTDDSGTAVVHCAPAFGEDDYRVCMEAGVVQKGAALVCPVDASGKFTDEVKDWAGVYVKDADLDIVRTLKANGRLVHQGQIDHSYPFCWRSETPLIYKVSTQRSTP